MAMWRRFDAGEIREDFARIAGLSLDTVRFFLRWDDFQPQADTLDLVMLDRLETLIALASEARLRTMPTLFTGHMSGVNWLPSWALDRNRHSRLRTIAGNSETPFAIHNMYAGPVLDAQMILARAVGERFREHPAVVAFDIGHGFSNVCEPPHAKIATGGHGTQPAAERDVAEWSRRLSNELKRTSSLPVTAGTFSGDITQDRDIRLGSLCAPFAFASMQGSNVHNAFARSRRDPEAIPFLAMIAASFSYKPVMITGFGNPTCPSGKFSINENFAMLEHASEGISPDDPVFAAYPCLTEDENAAYCTSVLERLHADGRLGAYWWCWADYAGDLHDVPPFDRAPHERTFGMVRADGSEKPVAAALAAFAREQRDVVRANDMPMISSEYYYRTLPTSTQTLYESFLGFIKDRRSGTQ
jgi:hypothetical protein